MERELVSFRRDMALTSGSKKLGARPRERRAVARRRGNPKREPEPREPPLVSLGKSIYE